MFAKSCYVEIDNISLENKQRKMRGNQQSAMKAEQKLRKQKLQEDLKQIIDQIKQTYFEFLTSLKFENISDKLSYKDMMKNHRPHSTQQHKTNGNHSVYDVDNPNSSYNNIQMAEQSHGAVKQSIQEMELKTFSFEEELSVENKGYMAFIRLINNIKQLQDYNHYLRSIVMNCDNEGYLEKFQNELLEDLRKLQYQIPNQYFMKKP